jgi:hypothetical protein
MPIRAVSLLLCGRLHVVSESGNLTLGEVFTRVRATSFPTTEQTVVAYALLVGEPGEKAAATFECYEIATGKRILSAHDEVEMGEEGKRSVAVSFDGFRFPHAGKYRFTLTCDGEIVAEHTLPVVLNTGEVL